MATREANMSDKSNDDDIDETEPDPDALDDEIDEDPGSDSEGDAPAGDDEDDDENEETPAGARPSGDEDDDEDDDEVEADLDTILKERLASEDDEEDEEDEEDAGVITTAEGDRIPSKQEDEILCEGCFLLVRESQYDTRDNVPSCPHCGTQLNV